MLKNSFKESILNLSSKTIPAEGFVVTKVTPILITFTAFTGATVFTTTTVAVTKTKKY